MVGGFLSRKNKNPIGSLIAEDFICRILLCVIFNLSSDTGLVTIITTKDLISEILIASRFFTTRQVLLSQENSVSRPRKSPEMGPFRHPPVLTESAHALLTLCSTLLTRLATAQAVYSLRTLNSRVTQCNIQIELCISLDFML
jgi:hypothetical protein